MAHIATTSSQLAEFIAHQRQINAKLDCLPEILKTLKDHSDRLVSLERAVAQHPSASASSVALSGSDLTVSGIPAMIQDEPGLVVEKVFVALGLQNLLSHVLSVRLLTKTDRASVGLPSGASSTGKTTRLSYVVALTSQTVRDHIVSKSVLNALLRLKKH